VASRQGYFLTKPFGPDPAASVKPPKSEPLRFYKLGRWIMQAAYVTDELDVLCIIRQLPKVSMEEFVVKILEQSAEVTKLDPKKRMDIESSCLASQLGEV
jgi:hypothetical protein